MMSAEVNARERPPITSRCFVWNSKEPAQNKGLVPSNIDVLGTFYPLKVYRHYHVTLATMRKKWCYRGTIVSISLAFVTLPSLSWIIKSTVYCSFPCMKVTCTSHESCFSSLGKGNKTLILKSRRSFP